MKRVILTIFALASLLMAEVNWQPNYNAAKEEAKKSGKPMLVILVSHTCRWCRKLENRTLQNPKVVDYVNKFFVPVIVYRGEGDYPYFISSSMVPSTFFLTPNEKMIMKPSAGYWEPVEYISDLKLAIKKFKKQK
jgi:uncharacterized protein YyaL (SSP411 family)